MDRKRVTVIRIGPVFSTRSERHHTLCGAFFVLHCSRKTHKNFCPTAVACAKRAFLCVNGRPRKAELVL